MNDDIHTVLRKIKHDFENAITTSTFNGNNYPNGNEAKQALIRSQRLIGYIHENIKLQLINRGISPNKIFPSLGNSSPEIKIEGFLKSKNQDICVAPDSNFSQNLVDSYNLEEVMTINIRSQLSSLQKNIDTLYERTFAEALNLHLQFPKQVLGEVYLIPTHEYDDVPMKDNQVAFKAVSKIDNYIRMFQQINDRESAEVDEYKYERVCLLICDFQQSPPKLYQTTEELANDNLISDQSVDISSLAYDSFVDDLLAIHSIRFGSDKFS